MIKELQLNNRKIQYYFTVKNVKNINMRIKPNGTIWVSANRFISQKEIDKFIISKENMIIKALDRFESFKSCEEKKYFDEKEICSVIYKICEKNYPYYERLGVPFPKIVFRKMKSKWGSCHYIKGLLTFNTNLMYAPIECIEYIVLHEFTHFLVQNHSAKFYEELSKVCPNWKRRRNRLKDIVIL